MDNWDDQTFKHMMNAVMNCGNSKCWITDDILTHMSHSHPIYFCQFSEHDDDDDNNPAIIMRTWHS